MDFIFSEEQSLMQDMFRDFAEKEIKPLAAQADEQEEYPRESIEKMAEMGMFGIPFSEKYGGSGMDYLAFAMCVEELSGYCASTGTIVAVHTAFGCWPIFNFGTEEQKMRFLPSMLSGEKLGAFALTEPSAGSDAKMQKTVAEDKGDYYLLNGSKVFITNAGIADVFIVFAVTDKSTGRNGITAFILEKGMEGFAVGKHELKMGIRGSSTCELVLTDTKVPKENVLGKPGQGFEIAMQTLDGGRIGIAAQAVGIAQGAINEASKYVSERVQFEHPLSGFQNTKFRMADMQTNTDAARMLVYRAACSQDQGQEYGHLASMAKLFAAENAGRVTSEALQLFGGYGYTREYPVERMMRDAKITGIYAGTNEVQRIVIAKWMGLR